MGSISVKLERFPFTLGVRHKTLALEGVQFHPESVLTPEGERLMANFMRMTT